MFLPQIRTAETDKEQKRMEMIGERFRKEHSDAAMIIEIEYFITSDFGLADALEEHFPKFYRHFGKKVQDDWEEWCDKYDEECDPPMDKFHYLRAEI
jgi:hypothetical protein